MTSARILVSPEDENGLIVWVHRRCTLPKGHEGECSAEEGSQ